MRPKASLAVVDSSGSLLPLRGFSSALSRAGGLRTYDACGIRLLRCRNEEDIADIQLKIYTVMKLSDSAALECS